MASRSRSRQFALQLLYQQHFSGNDLERDKDLFWDGIKADSGTRSFCEDLVRGVLEKRSQLDLEVAAYLKNWALDRIVLIDRLILQIAFYELLHTREIPWKVVVDEAVMLGKMFSSDKSAHFINGVLHAWSSKNREENSRTAQENEASE